MALDRLTQITSSGISSNSTLTVGVVAGVITATSANIEGTLTYDDVTSVDSIGIITARNDVHVGRDLSVAGVSTFVGITTAESTFFTNQLSVSGVSTFADKVHLLDGDRFHFGGTAGQDGDLQIGHVSNVSTINDVGSGGLYVQSNGDGIFLRKYGGEKMGEFFTDGAVELYHDNSKKFETTNTGAVVTGILTAGSITVGDKFLNSSGVGLGQTTTIGRDAGISTATGTLIYNASSRSVQVYNGTNWANVSDAYLVASGGTVNEYLEGSTVYRSHTFTSSGTFQVENAPADSNTIEYLVVGGGGAGAAPYGGPGSGGGGAGAMKVGSLTVNSLPGTYTVTIGAGGATRNNATPAPSRSGGSTSFGPVTSSGGGGGGSGYGPWYPNNTYSSGAPGGSGGGGGGDVGPSVTSGQGTGTGDPYPGSATTSPPNGWGNDGGQGTDGSGSDAAGGGGGAGGVGGNAFPGPPLASTTGGAGGNGLSNTYSTGSPIIYAAGGGGGGSGGSGGAGGSSGVGGPGGGGGAAGTKGTESTGSGGGGAGGPNAGSAGYWAGGAGGSGIVVVRYQISSQGTAKATGGLIRYTGDKTVHVFNSSGTFTVTDSNLTSVDYLVVAGGAGGGSGWTNSNVGAGGGGAGGLRNGTGLPVSSSPGVYPVVVGSGGQGAGQDEFIAGRPGTPSTFSTITSQGGGGGATRAPSNTPAHNGGSGGGSCFPGPQEGLGNREVNSSTPAPSQGNNGGTSPTPGTNPSGGGGGGAGGAGGAGVGGPTNALGGAGGNGLPFAISGDTVTYAGGGGGGGGSPGGEGGAGGPGGGGAGGPDSDPGAVGQSNKGGGGGGGGGAPAGVAGSGGRGGSGIVIISYPT